jgi:hypothetical protein
VNPSLALQIARDAIVASETGAMLSVPTELSIIPTTTNIANPGINSIPTAAAASFSVTSAFDLTDTTSATVAAKATGTSLNAEPAMPSDNLSKGAIAGIVVAGVSIVVLAAIVAFFIYRRRKRRSAVALRELTSGSDSGLLSPPVAAVPIPDPAPPMIAMIQPVSPIDLQETRDLETARSPPTQEREYSLDNESVISPLEPSPLQTLIIHGRYPNR